MAIHHDAVILIPARASAPQRIRGSAIPVMNADHAVEGGDESARMVILSTTQLRVQNRCTTARRSSFNGARVNTVASRQRRTVSIAATHRRRPPGRLAGLRRAGLAGRMQQDRPTYDFARSMNARNLGRAWAGLGK